MSKKIIFVAVFVVSCASAFSESTQEYNTIVTDFNVAEKFIECYPQIAKLQAYDEIPFQKVTEDIAHSALNSKRVTPVIFTFDKSVIFPNKYAIHSISCVKDNSKLCHYLSVMPTLGIPQNRVYGPLGFPCAINLKN